jgi:hypothetical protein
MWQLMEWPSVMARDYELKFCDGLAAALDNMSKEGWKLICTYAHPGYSGPGYAIFRRDVSTENSV